MSLFKRDLNELRNEIAQNKKEMNQLLQSIELKIQSLKKTDSQKSDMLLKVIKTARANFSISRKEKIYNFFAKQANRLVSILIVFFLSWLFYANPTVSLFLVANVFIFILAKSSIPHKVKILFFIIIVITYYLVLPKVNAKFETHIQPDEIRTFFYSKAKR